MAVNYTIQNVPISIDTNTSWNEQDVYVPVISGLSGTSSGDGVADNTTVPLRMVITPNNGYVVEASQFTVSGVEPLDTNVQLQFDIGNGNNEVVSNARQWYSGYLQTQSESFLTWGSMIDSIVMYDSGTPLDPDNTVVVLAYLSSNYQVGTDNIVISIDIDGDAVSYSAPSQSSQFYISVELINANPNAKVFSVLPSGLNNNVSDFPISWSLMTVDPDWGWDSLNQTRASVLCSFNGSQAQQENASLMWPGTNNHNQAWFWIVPNPGYTVSRHNFFIGNSDISQQQLTGYWNESDLLSYNTNSVSTSGTGANLSNYTEAEIISNCTIPIGTSSVTDPNNMCSGAYPYVGWGDSDQNSTYFNVGTTVGAALFNDTYNVVNATELYGGQNGVYSSSATLYNSTSQILFIDTAAQVDTSASETFSDIDYPYGLLNDTFTNGVLPSNLCPIDWSGNAVLIAFNGIKDYTPGLNPKNIVLKVDGSAMFDDGSICVDVDIDIIPDCIDGFDEFGNPC